MPRQLRARKLRCGALTLVACVILFHWTIHWDYLQLPKRIASAAHSYSIPTTSAPITTILAAATLRPGIVQVKDVWNNNGLFETKGALRAIDGDVRVCHEVPGPSAAWMLEFAEQVNLSAVNVHLRKATPKDVLETIEVSFGRIEDPSDLLSGLVKVWTARAKKKLPLVLTFDLPPSLTNWSIVMVERTTTDPLHICEVIFKDAEGDAIALEYNSQVVFIDNEGKSGGNEAMLPF